MDKIFDENKVSFSMILERIGNIKIKFYLYLEQNILNLDIHPSSRLCIFLAKLNKAALKTFFSSQYSSELCRYPCITQSIDIQPLCRCQISVKMEENWFRSCVASIVVRSGLEFLIKVLIKDKEPDYLLPLRRVYLFNIKRR